MSLSKCWMLIFSTKMFVESINIQYFNRAFFEASTTSSSSHVPTAVSSSEVSNVPMFSEV
ncbi:hypothetical protein Scep_023909 [Stephania cephalantha]|uniref:Uncharacterized protein n=1 Tax=Stephania cephalantha TaxID=152367 RepID=A0AAP0F4H8_9MAGN